MLIRVWFLLAAFLPVFVPLEAGFLSTVRSLFGKNQHEAPVIDVLIVNDKPSAVVEVKGKYQLYNPYENTLISKRYIGKKKLMQTTSSGLKWGEEFPGIYQLMIVPEEPHGVVSIDGVEYKGSTTIYDIGGSISIVNRVPIEDYLRATLPGAYSNPMPEEALAAIAIAARTHAYYLSRNPKNRFWAVDGIQSGYGGLASMHPSSSMDTAVTSTRHMILSETGAYEGKATPFPAHWSDSREAYPSKSNSRITLYEAEEIARTGGHAAQILSKAFPGSHIELIH